MHARVVCHKLLHKTTKLNMVLTLLKLTLNLKQKSTSRTVRQNVLIDELPSNNCVT